MAVIASANGRVNLIGEHTDYNMGFVLPTSIPQKTQVVLSLRDDRWIHLRSANVNETAFIYEMGRETRVKSWADYVQGVTWIIRKDFPGDISWRGFDLDVSSDIPMGSGLSSSAALLVAVFRALREAMGLEGLLDDITIAQLCQRVENEFVGARVGIMDPMAASLAEEGMALFIDTRSLSFERIAIPIEVMELSVISSGTSHSHAHGGYNQRRTECETACRMLGVNSLREVGLERLFEVEQLPDPYSRRARHVITENDRVLKAVDALRRGDCMTLGQLFKESHESMRDDYEVSVPEVDKLVEIANSQKEVFGARLTGGGFGGSIVMAVEAGKAFEVSQRIATLYRRTTRRNPQILVPFESSKQKKGPTVSQ